MECFKHKIQFTYGQCPICAQESHNSTVVRHMQLQQDLYFAKLKFEANQSEKKKAQEVIKFITSVGEEFGYDFLVKFYLRFLVNSPSIQFSKLIEDYYSEVLFADADDEILKVIRIQRDLYRAICKMKERRKTIEERDETKKTMSNFWPFGGLGIGLLVGFGQGLAVLFYMLSGIIIGSLIGWIFLAIDNSKKNSMKANDITNENIKSRNALNALGWFRLEDEKSREFYQSVSKGEEFMNGQMKKWSKEELTLQEVEEKARKDLKLLAQELY